MEHKRLRTLNHILVSDLLTVHKPLRALRSSDFINPANETPHGDRAFSSAAQRQYYDCQIILEKRRVKQGVFLSNINLVIFRLWPNMLSFVWFFKLIILCRFCQALFLPELLSNQHLIWTPYSQSSQVFCYDFTKSSSIPFRIYPGFSWSQCCSSYMSNANGSICLLAKWADTTFWMAVGL